MALHDYLFDLKLFASVRVQAESRREATLMVKEAFDRAEINAGAWPNGEPILCTASMDGDADLFEVDGRSI